MHDTGRYSFEFGPFHLETDERRLSRGDEAIRLTPKAFDALTFLIRRAGHLVTKDELIQALWPDAYVEENNLAQYVSSIRRALGEGADGATYIETVPRSGYRFVAQVRERSRASDQPILALPAVSLPQAEAPTPVATAGDPPRPPVERRRVRRGPVAAGALAALGLVVALFPWRSGAAPSTATSTLVVLPFDGANDPTSSGLGLALASDLIDRLAASVSNRVLPLPSVYPLVNAPTPPLTAARDLGAGIVLTGRIETKAESALAITATLTRVADGYVLWSGSVDATPEAIEEAEPQLAAPVAVALGGSRIHASAPRRSRDSFEARQAYTAGRYLWATRSPEGLFRSVSLLERAVALAPAEPHFRAALADAYAFDLAQWPKAELEAHQALTQGSNLGEPHATLGFIQLFWRRNHPAAVSEFKTAISLEPAYATAHQWYALALAARGESNGAADEIQVARRLEPQSAAILADQCHIKYLDRKFDAALAACNQALQLDPGLISAHEHRLAIYEATRQDRAAIDEYAHLCVLHGAAPCHYLTLAGVFQIAGEGGSLPTFWRAETHVFEGQPVALVPTRRLAGLYARLGNADAAIGVLRQLVGTTDLDDIFVAMDPVFDGVRMDARFLTIAGQLLAPEGAPAHSPLTAPWLPR